MSKKYIVALIAVIAIVIYFIITYNNLVRRDEGVKLMWNEMQNNYQRRADLVPSLVAVVQGSAAFEKKILEEIAQKRSAAVSNLNKGLSYSNYNSQEKTQAELANSMNRLIAVVEDYPDLKSTEAFVGLQTQLEGTERRIKIARKDFNETINLYNQSVRQFPSSLVANLFGFKAKEGFAAEPGSDNAPEVKF
ncbi:LemA family protein [Lacibacter sp. H375]|uniref:LemA family protein n=1 Tax=Lacibacter sp. H375 TaxID=3133424 RepID=UPI0030C05B81